MKKYDIFISYRRSGYDIANLIATRLKSAGYTVFFDMEALRTGKFNEQLFEAIDNCKDFLVVLPPEALDRCVSEDDWVRLEVCRALSRKKNIIPVMLNGFVWPNPMPQGLEELCKYQALTASSIQFFDMAMEKLQKDYLVSKRHLPITKIVKGAGVVIASLLVIISILWGVFLLLSRDVCTKYATVLTKNAGYVHILAEENYKLRKDWEVFDNSLNYEHNPERIAAMQEDMLNRIDVTEKNIKLSDYTSSAEMKIGDYHTFLLSLHRINAEEIALSPQLASIYYNDYLNNQLNSIRNAVRNPVTINRRYASVLFEVFEHSTNVYYVSMLSELSAFPEYSRKIYRELYPEWKYFPIRYYKLDEDRAYYEDVIKTESDLSMEALSRYESVIEKADAQLNDLQRKSDDLEKMMYDGFAQLEARADSTMKTLQRGSDIIELEKQNEKELAIKNEKAKAKKVEVKALRADIEELDRQYVESYKSLREKCTIDAEDGQWYKWGKIRRMGNFLSTIVESRKKLEAMGVYASSSITPEVVYAEINSLLTVYQSYHPESKEYATAAQLFYKAVARRKLPYAGTIIFGFKDDVQHNIFRKGDIIVKYGENQIKNNDELKAAYKKDSTATATYLRVVDGGLKEFETKIEKSEIIGFIELTEN